MTPRIERLESLKALKKVDAFLFTSTVTIKYLSGYYYNFETGHSPFHLLPSALLVVPTQVTGLVIADDEAWKFNVPESGILVRPYESYVFEKALDYEKQFMTQLVDLIRQTGTGNGCIGIENNFMPYSVATALKNQFPEIRFVDISSDIAEMRVIKDADEIELIRKAATLCDVGQEAVLRHSKPGISELDLFSIVRGAMENSGGTRVPFLADLVSGKTTASAGGNPSGKIIEDNDLIISDLVPCLNGYWGDSCNTVALKDPTLEQKKTFERVREALEIGINAVKTGVMAMEVDRLMREHTGGFPHHGGHGVGVQYHEEPRIVPYNNTKLRPGMVITLEPGIYKEDFGIRLEHLMVVTETGCELLTKFKHRFEID